jgi:Na+/proline symporter
MIYRALNPELSGLQDEGAYLLMCKEVLPAGMLGLMLISLVFATNSSVQGVLNISAGVITNDLYKSRFPETSEKKLMAIAKFASIFFGLVTITIALLVPFMGGAKEVVLSIAALTGCPLYMPLIWSLFSKKQTGKTVLATTIISLLITLSFKFLFPSILDFTLSRAGEMILGVVVPAVLISITEIILRIRKSDGSEYKRFQISADAKKSVEISAEAIKESADENKQGLKMIATGIIVTGLIIGVLGLMAENGRFYVLGIAAILLLLGGRIYLRAKKSKSNIR